MPRTTNQDRNYVIVCDEYVTKPMRLDVAERTLREIEADGHCREVHRIVTVAEHFRL